MTRATIINKINNHYIKKSYFADKLGLTFPYFSNMLNKKNNCKMSDKHKEHLENILTEFEELDKKITVLTH